MNQTEWIPFEGTFEDFEKADLAAAGVLIEDDHGCQELIGHINELGGVCDCCSYLGTVVVRYRVVWRSVTD
jgi:hypothetical protein